MDSTRIYCAPVKREPFQYDGLELRVNHISRCPSQDLYALLTWVDKGGQCSRRMGNLVSTNLHLIRTKVLISTTPNAFHYGIKPFKTRPAAKKALLEAFAAHGNHLVVPQSILDVEAELKEEFAQANKTAKEVREAEKLEHQQQIQREQMKRKREEDSIVEEVSAKSAKHAKQKQSLDLQAVAGAFSVAAPSLLEGYGSSDDGTYIVRLAPLESQSDTIYSDFNFGAFMGYLRSTSINKRTRTIDFNWRGRETGEGRSTFGPQNTFQLAFVDDESFEGYAQGDYFERCEIYGKRKACTGPGGRPLTNAAAWKYQYDSLNETSCERERVSRWH